MIKEFKASTKRGQNIIARASNYEGYILSDVYGRASKAKELAFDSCYELYSSSKTSRDFHICSHNTFQFSVAWNDIWDNEKVLCVETANNSYLVWLER